MEASLDRVRSLLESFPSSEDESSSAAVGLAAARLISACSSLESLAVQRLRGAPEAASTAHDALCEVLPALLLALCADGDAGGARLALLRYEAILSVASLKDNAAIQKAAQAAQALNKRDYERHFNTLHCSELGGDLAKLASGVETRSRREVWRRLRSSHVRVSVAQAARKLGLDEQTAMLQAKQLGWRLGPVAADVMDTEASSAVLERDPLWEDDSSAGDSMRAEEAAARATARIQALVGKVLALEKPAGFDVKAAVEAAVAETKPVASNNLQGS